MPEKTLSESVLGPLLTSEQFELRQLPKTVARTFISLQQKPELVLEKDPLPNEFLVSFGSRVSQLPTGLVLELWKTFLYHLESDVFSDLKTPKAKNMTILIDQLMSTFLNAACVVEQSLPQRMMDKIVEMIDKTNSQISSAATSFPRVQTSLFELSILLKNCRQIEMSEVTEGLKKTSGNKLLKRKLESLEESREEKKVRTTLCHKDIFPENVKFLSVVIDQLSENDVLEAAKVLLKKENLLGQSAKVVSEDQRLQVALVVTAFEKIGKHLGSNHESKDFFAAILTDSDSWFKSNENDSKLTKSAECLKQMILVKPEKAAIFSVNEALKLLQMLPLECIRGEFETLISLLVIWIVISRKSDHATIGQLIRAFARCLDGTFRVPSVLKYVDFSLLAPKLSKVDIQAEDRPVMEQILYSLAKITTTYQKTLETVSKNVELFSAPLETLTDVSEVRMSVVFLESISKNVSNKDASAEKKTSSRNIFDKLCQSLEKGLKTFESDSDCSELNSLAVRSFNAVVETLTHNLSSEKASIKKWLKFATKFTSFALQTLDESDGNASCCQFLGHVWTFRKDIKNLPEDFSSDLWKKIVDGKRIVFASDDGKNLVTKMFVVADEKVLRQLTQVLLSETSLAVESDSDLSHLMQLWTFFVSLNLDESVAQIRKDILMQLNQILQIKVLSYSKKFYKNFLIPCLNFEAAILETEKPLLHRESEAMCLINSSSLDLEKVLETSDSIEEFANVWKAVYRILSAAFHKRSSSVVLPRIPIVLAVLRNLLRSLVRASDQTRKVSASELKELVLLAHLVDRICEHIRKLKDDFARVAPYVVADVVDCFQRITLYTPVKANLLIAVHKLLDICDKHSVEMLAGILPVGRKDIFKHVTAEYRKYFKYSGKV